MSGLHLSLCDRSVAISLEGCGSTIELYPQINGLAPLRRLAFTARLQRPSTNPAILERNREHVPPHGRARKGFSSVRAAKEYRRWLNTVRALLAGKNGVVPSAGLDAPNQERKRAKSKRDPTPRRTQGGADA